MYSLSQDIKLNMYFNTLPIKYKPLYSNSLGCYDWGYIIMLNLSINA